MSTNWFTQDIGIDLGTANTLVYLKNKGIIIDEPSVVAINSKTQEIIAVGIEAKEMIGKVPEGIVLIRPLKEGVVADFDMTYEMIKYFLNKSIPRRSIFKRQRVIIGVPSKATTVEKRAVIEAALMARAKDALIIEEPIAAAIGANLPIEEAFGHLIVDIGGGTTEIAVVSLGGIVVSDSLKIAGDEMDQAIVAYVRKKYQIMIGENAAELIKKTVGTAGDMDIITITITGRDLLTGLPKSVVIQSDEIFVALEDLLLGISYGIKSILEITHPELSADIMVQGMTLTGGGALIRGIDKFFEKRLSIPVNIVDEPLKSVAYGTGKALSNFDDLKRHIKA